MNRICTLFLITIFTSGVCYGETNINLLLKTDTIEICVGDSVQLVSELQGLIYYWTPKENITTDSVPYTTVTPSQTTTYILTALNPDLDQELIMNGDFSTIINYCIITQIHHRVIMYDYMKCVLFRNKWCKRNIIQTKVIASGSKILINNPDCCSVLLLRIP